MKRFGTMMVALLAILVAAAVGWWAARATLTSNAPEEAIAATEAVWAEASEASVGRSLSYSTTLRQPAVVVASNGLQGVVTAINPGEVDAGDVLYVVGNTPVRAVQAEQPMWRDLHRGVRGDDVAVLQALLTSLGHFDGEVDGVFGSGTERAVKAWQKVEGREQTGGVGRGELVALQQFPITVSLGEDIAVGRVLAGGEDAVLAPSGEREFVLVLTQDQARLVPVEATIDVMFQDKTWPAVIVASGLDENSQMVFQLAAPDGGEVCAADCGLLPLDPHVTLRSQVVVVPRVSGVGVPAAAVQTGPDGATFVITETGEVPVTVLGSGQGMVIVEGVDTGTKVQLAAGSADSETPSTEANGEQPAEPSNEPSEED